MLPPPLCPRCQIRHPSGIRYCPQCGLKVPAEPWAWGQRVAMGAIILVSLLALLTIAGISLNRNLKEADAPVFRVHQRDVVMQDGQLFARCGYCSGRRTTRRFDDNRLIACPFCQGTGAELATKMPYPVRIVPDSEPTDYR